MSGVTNISFNDESEWDNEWDDVSHCSFTPNKDDQIFLQVAGGGSHAWGYLIKNNNLYIWDIPDGQVLQHNYTLLFRIDNDEPRCVYAKMILKTDDIPENTDEYTYLDLDYIFGNILTFFKS